MNDLHLVSLVYTSTAVNPFDAVELDELLEHARRFNDEHAISGILLYRDGRFIQVIEGPDDEVHDLMARIEADARHEQVRILFTEPIDRRRFAEWTMGYQALSARESSDRAGFRDSFHDLDAGSSDDRIVRALRELTLWYRVRAG